MSEPTEPEHADPRLGRVLQQQYRLDKLLGEGGMGAVYRGEQLSVSRPVAIKLIAGKIAENPECVRRFRREAEAMAKLRHPNTVRLYDFGVAEPDSKHPELYMVMELLEGSDLSEQLPRRGRLSPEEALFVTRQVLEALAEAHSLGIVHRDLKPANIFLSHVHGGRTLVKVMDFGIAGIEQTEGNTKLTMTGAVMGTPAYMSPEQAQGKLVDGRSDLYSLGVVLFEMLAGKPPFEAESAVSLLLAQVSTPPPRLLELHPQLVHAAPLQQLLDALLDKRPEQRPASAQAAIELIDVASRALSLSPHAPTLHATPAQTARVAPSSGNVWAAQAQGTLSAPLTQTTTGLRSAHHSWFWLAGGAVLLVAGWLLRPSAVTPPPPMPETQARSTPPSVPAGVPLYSVQINSKPTGAGVELAGVEIGKTPYTLQFRRATTLRLALDGYASAQLNVDERSEPNLVLELTPLTARKGTRNNKGAATPESSAAPIPTPAPASAAAAPTSPAAAAAPHVAAAAPHVAAQPSTPRPAQGSALPASIPPPTWLSKVPIVGNALTGRDRREAMLRRGPPYRNVVAAKRAYRAGQLSEQDYEDTIWVLKTQRSNHIQAEKAAYKQGRITRAEYDRRVDRIDADYEGQ